MQKAKVRSESFGSWAYRNNVAGWQDFLELGHEFGSAWLHAFHESVDRGKELLEAGKVKPVIDRRYPLSEVAEALRYLEEGHARGKLVITIG